MKRMGWLAGVGALVLFGLLGVLGPAGWAQALDVPATALERDKPAEQADKPDHPEHSEKPDHPEQANNPEPPGQANNPEPPGQANNPEPPGQADNPEPPGQANNPEQPEHPEQANNPENPPTPGEGQGSEEPGNQGSGNAGEPQTPGPGGPQQSGLLDPPGTEGSGTGQEVPVQESPGVGEKPPVSGPPAAGGETTAGMGPSGSARMAQGFHALSAAVDEPLDLPVSVAEAEEPGFVSAIDHTLEPVLPPVLVSAFTSPLVVAGALVQAVTSSGQVLLLPAGLLVVGTLARLRRRPTRDSEGRRAAWPETAASREAAPAS